MIKNIKFTTADNVHLNDDVKTNAERNINNWLAPLEKELNEADAEIELYLDKDGEQHITVNNISDDLNSKVMERLSLFQNTNP